MCSAPAIPTAVSSAEIVDVSQLAPRDLEPLWEREKALWLDELYWDISPAIAVVRRAVGLKSLPGKAVRVARRIVGYGYYVVEGHRAILGDLILDSEAGSADMGAPLLDCLLESVQNEPCLARIESQFVGFGMPWLAESFHAKKFTEYPRAFLRRSLLGFPTVRNGLAPPWQFPFLLENWDSSCLAEASTLMQQAHKGSIDADMNELYRSRSGCGTLLHNILRLGGCGGPLSFASFVARSRKTHALIGLVIATEISSGNAHLAQVAVSPSAQGQGLGRTLIVRSLAALAEGGFRTVSLMVSGANRKAYSLYVSIGFETVLCFSAFSRDCQAPGARSR